MTKKEVIIDDSMSMYDNMEERMRMREAICKYLGYNHTPEAYLKFCIERGIEAPIIPPAYGWEP